MSNTQKVVIPKGLVNPNETTIVEIPKNLQNVGTVVARPRPNSQEWSTSGDLSMPHSEAVSPKTPKMVKKRSFTRRTYPPKRPQRYGMLHDEGVTWGGRPNDSESADESSRSAFTRTPISHDSSRFSSSMCTPPSHASPRYAEISPGDVSYAVGRGGKRGFKPRGVLGSTMQDIDDLEGSLYRDFRPRHESSRPFDDSGFEPPSMRRYESTRCSSMEESAPESYFKEEVTTDTGDEIKTEITEERSYYDYGGSTSHESSCPCSADYSGGSSGSYRRFDSSMEDSSGAYGRIPSPKTPRVMTQREVMNSLGELEAVELTQIMGDLDQFQNARRRLVFDASSLATASDVSKDLLSSTNHESSGCSNNRCPSMNNTV